MSSTGSDEMFRENLLPVEEQEKDIHHTHRRNRLHAVYRAVCKPRFFTNGMSIFSQGITVVVFLTAIYVAYQRGLGRLPPRSYRSYVPQSIPARITRIETW